MLSRQHPNKRRPRFSFLPFRRTNLKLNDHPGPILRISAPSWRSGYRRTRRAAPVPSETRHRAASRLHGRCEHAIHASDARRHTARSDTPCHADDSMRHHRFESLRWVAIKDSGRHYAGRSGRGGLRSCRNILLSRPTHANRSASNSQLYLARGGASPESSSSNLYGSSTIILANCDRGCCTPEHRPSTSA